MIFDLWPNDQKGSTPTKTACFLFDHSLFGGIGFVPEEFLEKWSNVCRIDLEEKIPERNVVVIKRKGQPLSVAAKELEKMILAAEK